MDTWYLEEPVAEDAGYPPHPRENLLDSAASQNRTYSSVFCLRAGYMQPEDPTSLAMMMKPSVASLSMEKCSFILTLNLETYTEPNIN